MDTTQQSTFLIVDDTPEVLAMMAKMLETAGHRTIAVSNGRDAVNAVAAHRVDAVFMDVQMPEMDGLEAMALIKSRSPHIPVIVITGNGSVNVAIKAMRQGAFDYIAKPFTLAAVRDISHRALTSAHVSSPAELTTLATTASGTSAQEDVIIGASKPMQEVFKLIGLITSTPNHTSVLITGESGTGKELIARAIHANSLARADSGEEAFVGINCTAIPENLLESELFGSERGAYTGAMNRRIGKFELAGMGTIFLDEIGDLPLSLQAKLLRVLQERSFERVGGNEPIPVRARFVVATHRNLADEVKVGRFREDLFYRLNVAVVQLPALRERNEDIRTLANYFLAKYNASMNKAVVGFSNEALEALEQYAFPGNVRELENIVERALMLTTGNLILPQSLGLLSRSGSAERETERVAFTIEGDVFSEERDAVIAEFERQFVMKLLKAHNGNVSAAAEASQMSRQNFHRLMQKYSVDAELFRNGV
jgi:DNA-binding NtrC family response regulator